ncbi:MAG: helix-turn-helix transcriptional regulator [Bacteroidetes bacterium]|nr:helix-turn-helix transcriptional regulator [Bacteroidota bacterium]
MYGGAIFERLTDLSLVINIKDKAFLKAFGAHLKGLRKAKGISQENLALDANIAENQVGLIEKGKINTSISTLYVLSKALNINYKELLDFDLKESKK